MDIIRYTFARLKRKPLSVLATISAFIAVALVLMLSENSIQTRQDGLNALIRNIPIKCTTSDRTGLQTDSLAIANTYYESVLDERTLFASFLKDLCLKTELACKLDTENDLALRLTGITRTEATYELAYENAQAVLYDTGYDETLFHSTKQLCIISSDLIPYVTLNDKGERFLALKLSMLQQNGKPLLLHLKMRVAGEVANGAGAVYCPWEMLLDFFETEAPETPFFADTMSFTLSDNLRLDEFREFAKLCFVEANYLYPDMHFDLALTIHDAQYLRMTLAARKNLALLLILRPILCVCALGAGVLIAVFQMRNRKSELAILRGLGTKKRFILFQCSFEYLALCAISTALLLPFTHVRNLASMILLLLFFLAGALIPVIRYLTSPIMKQIKDAEG